MRAVVTRQAIIEAFEKAIKIDQLNKVVYSLADLLITKNAKYGDAWQLFDLLTPLIRINEKRIRVRQLLDAHEAVFGSEIRLDYNGLVRELADIIGYCVLALVWLMANKNVDAESIIKAASDD